MYRNPQTGEEMDDQVYWEILYNGERSLDDFEELPTTLIGTLEVLVEDLEAIIAHLKEQLEFGDFAEDPAERDELMDKLAILQRLH